MHVFVRPKAKPSPLSKEQTTVSYMETHPHSRDGEPTSSPPLTSSLHSRNSAPSAEESAYLRQAGILKWARLCFALFTTGISLTIVGVLAHLLRTYNDTVMPGEYYLVLWPLDTDLRPTLAVLIPAALTALGSLLYIVFAILPSPRSRFLTQNYLFAFIFASGAIASVIAIAVNFSIERNVSDPTSNDTIRSWTCTFYNNARQFVTDSETLQISVALDPILPAGFGLMCVESLVAEYMTVGLCILQVFGLSVAFIGLSAEKKISRVRGSRLHEKSSFA